MKNQNVMRKFCPRGVTIFMALLLTALGLSFKPGDLQAAAASRVACGATLGAGNHELAANLVCNPGRGAAVLTLTTNAHLNMKGKTVSCNNGADGIGIKVTGTGVHITNGHVHRCGTGLLLEGGGNHHLSKLHVDGNLFSGAGGDGDGIVLRQSHNNHIKASTSSHNQSFGVNLVFSHRNTFEAMVVTDNVGPSHSGGYLLFGANGNVITASNISRNGDVGIQIHSSDGNTVSRNTVNDSNFFGQPTTNILLLEDADSNVISHNKVSSTVAGTALDGINVGCKGRDCTSLGTPETGGADKNRIESNTANNNARFGIAQAPGNVGNV
jgi:parallel beta-helix repeat protein